MIAATDAERGELNMGDNLQLAAAIMVLFPIGAYVLARMATKAYFFSKLEFLTKVKQKGW
ncbi:hypothetical protein [Vibrio phage F23s1]|nr:hypothetical protein [Vibrio phage F23s1]